VKQALSMLRMSTQRSKREHKNVPSEVAALSTEVQQINDDLRSIFTQLRCAICSAWVEDLISFATVASAALLWRSHGAHMIFLLIEMHVCAGKWGSWQLIWTRSSRLASLLAFLRRSPLHAMPPGSCLRCQRYPLDTVAQDHLFQSRHDRRCHRQLTQQSLWPLSSLQCRQRALCARDEKHKLLGCWIWVSLIVDVTCPATACNQEVSNRAGSGVVLICLWCAVGLVSCT
jgi:hypothetical protein